MPPKKKTLRFSLSSCGCRDTKSVSISDTPDKSSPNPIPDISSETPRPGLVSTSETLTSSSWESKDDPSLSGDSSSSFSSLLRQLNELEQSVLAWGFQIPAGRLRHSRSRSEGGRVGESVAVEKDSDDPLTDFRRSMLQMIVEKEIVGAEELKELLRIFLELNARQHHEVILRAFMEIWNDVFSGYQNTPEFMVNFRA